MAFPDGLFVEYLFVTTLYYDILFVCYLTDQQSRVVDCIYSNVGSKKYTNGACEVVLKLS